MVANLASWVIVASISVQLIYARAPAHEYLVPDDDLEANGNELAWMAELVELESGDNVVETRDYLVTIRDKLQKVQTNVGNDNLDSLGDLVPSEEPDKLYTLWYLMDDFVRISEPVRPEQCLGQTRKFDYYFKNLHLALGLTDSLAKCLESGTAPERHLKLFNYMKHYATEYYQHCLPTLAANLEVRINFLNPNDEQIMDRLTAATWTDLDAKQAEAGHSRDTGISQLIKPEKMRKFDLEKFSELADDVGSLHLTDAEKIKSFLKNYCSNLDKKMGPLLDGLNLSLLLVNEQVAELELPPRFFNLNEHWRACHQTSGSIKMFKA